MQKTLDSSGSRSSIIITTTKHPLTVVYTPVPPAHNLMKICKSRLSTYLETLAPGHIKEARLNRLRNAVIIDTDNTLAVEALLYVTTLRRIPVRPYIPRGPTQQFELKAALMLTLQTMTSSAKCQLQRKSFKYALLRTSFCVDCVRRRLSPIPSQSWAGSLRRLPICASSHSVREMLVICSCRRSL